MSSAPPNKRKKPPVKKPAKRGKKKDESDVDSDISEGSDIEQGPTVGNQPDEILIPGHGDPFDVPTKLPEELLKTIIKPANPLLMFGMVSWDLVGRRENKKLQRTHPNLYSPHRFKDIRVRLAVSGSCSPHSVVVNEDGQAMTFGRNQYGQLGTGDLVTKDHPTLVTALENENIIGAACGRNHTLFLTGKPQSQ